MSARPGQSSIDPRQHKSVGGIRTVFYTIRMRVPVAAGTKGSRLAPGKGVGCTKPSYSAGRIEIRTDLRRLLNDFSLCFNF